MERTPEQRQLWDAARRLSDAVHLHLFATNGEAAGRWVAARLDDGSTDGVAYDTRDDAIRHHPDYHLYAIITPDGMSVREAEQCLRVFRGVWDAGNPTLLTHPTREFVVPVRMEDLRGL